MHMAGLTSLIHIAASRLGRVHVIIAASIVGVCAASCAKKAPTHNGYAVGTSNQGPSRPWARAATVKLDSRGKLSAELALSYPERARAKWLSVDVPASGELTLTLDVFPTSSSHVPVGLELYDGALKRVLGSDEAMAASTPAEAKAKEPDEDGFVEATEESEVTTALDADDTAPQHTFERLAPGRYFIHLFVGRRLDAATVEMSGTFTAGAGPSVAAANTTLVVADVALTPALPLVPVTDDTPGLRTRDKSRDHDVRKSDKKDARKPDKPVAPDPAPATEPAPSGPPTTARIINVSVVSGGTEITINRGVDHGLQNGVAGAVVGIKQGAFTLARCAPRTCKATVKATAAELAGASKVTLTP